MQSIARFPYRPSKTVPAYNLEAYVESQQLIPISLSFVDRWAESVPVRDFQPEPLRTIPPGIYHTVASFIANKQVLSPSSSVALSASNSAESLSSIASESLLGATVFNPAHRGLGDEDAVKAKVPATPDSCGTPHGADVLEVKVEVEAQTRVDPDMKGNEEDLFSSITLPSEPSLNSLSLPWHSLVVMLTFEFTSLSRAERAAFGSDQRISWLSDSVPKLPYSGPDE